MRATPRLPTLLAGFGLFLAVAGWSLALGPAETKAKPPEENASQVCRREGDADSSHGGCVSSVTSGNLTAAAADGCRDPEFRALFGLANHGQCLQVFKDPPSQPR